MNNIDIAIVGGGLAGASAAESYRAAVGTGSVLMLSSDPDLPVHRPPLSKGFLQGKDSLDAVYVHGPEFYRDRGIDLRLGTKVDRLDLAGKRITTAHGDTIEYDKLVLATGATPRAVRLKGADLDGIYSLRSLTDANNLKAAAGGARQALIIGAGFVGMEVAASLTQLGLECTILELAPRVWPRLVSPGTSEFMQRYFEQRGVRFIFGQGIAWLEGTKQVSAAVLDHGERVETELVVAGVGVELNTQLAAQAGLVVERGVVVDEHLRTSDPDVYAIGDIANFPDPIAGRIHLEHWDNALHQGRSVGATLAGDSEPFHHSAYFFSDLFDLSLNMIGYPSEPDTILVRGNPADGQFTDLYVKDGRLRAALMFNDDRSFDAWQRLVETRQPVAGLEARLSHAQIDPLSVLQCAVEAAG